MGQIWPESCHFVTSVLEFGEDPPGLHLLSD